ncbi:PEP-CTERM putative exosortase interaction domain-containing protein [Pleurocapsa sp. PCC 7327]|uniref:PEP-CTERM sorting domain-containing protein n=1 Tax=Pleurocapsa sp. PCC 7327 TaxID=118163 RepID=UPI00029FEEB0|nr:PEP-CTERM sorting domain-containing protein [Pleurocapsa sp. PCC 7327]AFY75971.1 PEP-CTERM putative exosortase interaction domain-containing protein [Pleurocapsa sp. PCC 7327]
MNWKISSAIGSLAFLSASALCNANPASAAIIGTIEIGGANIEARGLGITSPEGSPLTTIDFGWFGDQTPAAPDQVAGFGEFNITSADGVFAANNPPPPQAGRVRDLPVNGAFEPVPQFLRFASNFGNTVPVTDPSQFNTSFNISSTTPPVYKETARGINVAFDVTGTFNLPDGRTVDGEGIVGGEVLFSSQPGTPFNNLTSFLNYISVQGNVVNIDSWSGNLNARIEQVPEPASVLGLLAATGLAGATMRKGQRKQKS